MSPWFVAVRRGYPAFAASVLALSVAGCAVNCDRNPDDPPVPYKEGVTSNGFYDSVRGENHDVFLDFPPGRTIRFYHQLGGVPREIKSRIAFGDRCGAADGIKQSAECAGSQCTLETPTDPTFFDVRNDTCSDVCIAVTASNPILSSEPSDGDDETDAGDEPVADAAISDGG